MKVTPPLPARTYPGIPEAAFCPKCHKRVQIPAFLRTANIGGEVRLSCGCKGGIVVIRPKRNEVIRG